jgi:hypothetical protein
MDIPAILGSLGIPAATAQSAPTLASLLLGQTVEATLETVLPESLLLRLADGRLLEAQGSLPFPAGSALALMAQPLPAGGGLRLQVIRATPPASPSLLAPLVHGEAALLLARLQASPQSPLAELLRGLLQTGAALVEQPEAWGSWLKAGMKALSDPATSPDEAAFHRLQAKEGTAWFELPLPWMPGAEPMRIWIEGESPSAASGEDPVHRVFLSVAFSALGEVRLGLEQRASGLRVRLWLPRPEQVEGLKQDLEAELASLGRPVDLQLLPLPPGAPDLRALAGGGSLQALG